MQQATLNLASALLKGPSQDEVERLVTHLYAAGECWSTARQIAATLGLTDRQVRKLAEHSAGRIISAPGCPGYRHLHHCTAAQLAEVADRLKSQAKAMLQRSFLIRRMAHSLIR